MVAAAFGSYFEGEPENLGVLRRLPRLLAKIAETSRLSGQAKHSLCAERRRSRLMMEESMPTKIYGTEPVKQQLRQVLVQERLPGDPPRDAPTDLTPSWYWTFRYLFHRTRHTFGSVPRPVDRLLKRLSTLAARAEAGQIDVAELWNVHGILSHYLSRVCTADDCRHWYVDGIVRAEASEQSWLVVCTEEDSSDGSGLAPLDTSRARALLAQMARLHTAALREVASGSFRSPHYINADYRIERGVDPFERVRIEKHILVALAEVHMYRAAQKLSEFELGIGRGKDYPPKGPKRPSTMPPKLEDALTVYKRFEAALLTAMPNWHAARSYPLYRQLLRHEAGWYLPSNFVPFTRIADYYEWFTSAHIGMAMALRAQCQQDSSANDCAGLARDLLVGAVANAVDGLRAHLFTLGLAEDDPRSTDVCMRIGQNELKRIDRAAAYLELFTPKSTNHKRATTLRNAYRTIQFVLEQAFKACLESQWIEAGGNFASQLLQLDSVAIRYGFVQRRDPETDHVTGSGINLHISQLRKAFAAAKNGGFLIPRETVAIFDASSNAGAVPHRPDRIDSSLEEYLQAIFYPGQTAPTGEAAIPLLYRAARFLRKGLPEDPVVHDLLQKAEELLRRFIEIRHIAAALDLMAHLRHLDIAAHRALATPALCAELAGIILNYFQYPENADLEARAVWQRSLLALSSNIDLEQWRARPHDLFLVLSATTNLALTTIRVIGLEEDRSHLATSLEESLTKQKRREFTTLLGPFTRSYIGFPTRIAQLSAYSTRWRTRFQADGGQCSTAMADTVPR